VSRILIVDDEPSICWGLLRLARAMGHRVDSASNAEHGLTLAAAARPDLLVLDVRLPGMDGLTAMELFRRHMADAPIIVMTAFGDLETAVLAVEKGAFEYLVKPFDLTEIRAAIERALRRHEPASAAAGAREIEGDEMIGQSAVMRSVFKRIALAANSDAAVLLVGESGVGKELAARAIHRHSCRRDAPFVAVNISSLSPALAEAELFGHAAATAAATAAGAAQGIRGKLAQADGGTLFFDDVAEIPLSLQVKLLHALDQGEVLPIGAERAVPSRFRIMSATNQDLRERAHAGAFRRELFLRLGTFEIVIPPLRDRCADIRLLAEYFARQFGSAASSIAKETLAELECRAWFGNVRELRNAIEHALVIARSGAVLPSHLPAPLSRVHLLSGVGADEPIVLGHAVAALAKSLLEDPANAGDVYERFLEEVEPPLLATALVRNGNRCAPAARALGLHRTTLKRKLDQYGLDEGPQEPTP
jgi:two-component system nitrogen regulation response regulator GlnG